MDNTIEHYNTLVRTLHHMEHYPRQWNERLDPRITLADVRYSKTIATDDPNFHALGKFQTALDERVWNTTMKGCDECGNVELGSGHHALVTFSLRDLIHLGIIGGHILHDEFVNIPVGCIVTTGNSDAVDVDYYDTGAELDKAWQEYLDEESSMSSEYDGFLCHNRGKWEIGLDGDYFDAYADRREATFMLYLECHKSGYFPNCWEVNDHGNEHPLFDTSEKVRDMLVEYVEFRDEREADNDYDY